MKAFNIISLLAVRRFNQLRFGVRSFERIHLIGHYLLKILCCGSIACGFSLVQAETVGNVSPGGATVITLVGNADNYISLPYPDANLCTCQVSAVGQTLLVLQGGEEALANLPQEVVFDDDALYYIEFMTGDLAGVRYDIVGESSGNLFLDTQGDDLRNHPVGNIALDDQLRIVKHWTLASVFGDDPSNLIIEPTVIPIAIKDIIFIPDNLRVGINKTPDSYYYLVGRGWRSLTDPQTDRGGLKILPGEGVIVRKRVAQDSQLISVGNNRIFPFSQYVPGGSPTSPNDLILSLQYPEAVALNDAGLTDGSHDGISPFKPSASPLAIQDRLFIYAAGSTQPLSLYYLDGRGWVDSATNQEVGATVTIEPGSAFYLRKTANSEATDWFFQPNP